ncbi:MAG: DUF4097 family beta strand repeat-containing protein [candidate division Zixibacteria bacterium]|nr:DUF4097 family beta strand repeat-containing protein [candidate division Zixibacteria bacterium]
MLKKRISFFFIILISLLPAVNLYAAREQEISKTFEAKKTVRITTVCGDGIIRPGQSNRIEVHLVYSFSPHDAYEPFFRDKGNNLHLGEEIDGSTSGRATWTLTVPPETKIDFSSASGDFEATSLTGRVIVETASGDITLSDYNGELRVESASGDIRLNNCRGTFKIETASGDIEALNTFIDQAGFFESASGDVYVQLAESAEFDLNLSSAAGRATLDYNGNPVRGHFEFVTLYRHGRISSPFVFDLEEEFERYRQNYIRKSLTLGSNTPEIIIETGVGKAILEK